MPNKSLVNLDKISQELKLNPKQKQLLEDYIRALMVDLLDSLKQDNIEEIDTINSAINSIQSQ